MASRQIGYSACAVRFHSGFWRWLISAIAMLHRTEDESSSSEAHMLLPLDSRRRLSLDLLRAVAILLVLYGHITFRIDDNAIGWRFWFILRQMGLIGVDLFYVLSGFLIGSLLLSEHKSTGRIAVGRFYIRPMPMQRRILNRRSQGIFGPQN